MISELLERGNVARHIWLQIMIYMGRKRMTWHMKIIDLLLGSSEMEHSIKRHADGGPSWWVDFPALYRVGAFTDKDLLFYNSKPTAALFKTSSKLQHANYPGYNCHVPLGPMTDNYPQLWASHSSIIQAFPKFLTNVSLALVSLFQP